MTLRWILDSDLEIVAKNTSWPRDICPMGVSVCRLAVRITAQRSVAVTPIWSATGATIVATLSKHVKILAE